MADPRRPNIAKILREALREGADDFEARAKALRKRLRSTVDSADDHPGRPGPRQRRMTGYVVDAKAVTGIRNASPFNYLGGYRAQGICWRCLRIWKQPLRLRPPRKTERTSPDASPLGRCAVSQEPPAGSATGAGFGEKPEHGRVGVVRRPALRPPVVVCIIRLKRG